MYRFAKSSCPHDLLLNVKPLALRLLEIICVIVFRLDTPIPFSFLFLVYYTVNIIVTVFNSSIHAALVGVIVYRDKKKQGATI